MFLGLLLETVVVQFPSPPLPLTKNAHNQGHKSKESEEMGNGWNWQKLRHILREIESTVITIINALQDDCSY